MMKFSTRPYLISVLALAAALVLSVAVGSVFIPPAALWDLIRAALTGSQPLLPQADTYATILLSLRLPRTLLVAITGAALATSGGAYQGLFRNPLADPFLLGSASGAALGVALLLWHELTNMAGKPLGVFMMLTAAATWAVGTRMLRRTTLPVPTLAISFWMTALTTGVMTVLATVFERGQWRMPSPEGWGAIVFNAIGVFAFAQAAWFYLARSLPPVASTLSVMFIPVLGVFSGALWLGEVLHWQDWAAVALMVLAIATVLLPGAGASASTKRS